MIKKWLHIEELYGDPWVLPIWSSVNDAVQIGKITHMPFEVCELGVYISTRLNILPQIVKRINVEVIELFKLAKSHEESHVFTTTSEGYALRIDNDLKYRIICDLYSLLFEINSVCELMSKFFESIYSHAGKPLRNKMVSLKTCQCKVPIEIIRYFVYASERQRETAQPIHR